MARNRWLLLGALVLVPKLEACGATVCDPLNPQPEPPECSAVNSGGAAGATGTTGSGGSTTGRVEVSAVAAVVQVAPGRCRRHWGNWRHHG